jgi:hypothetical protein
VRKCFILAFVAFVGLIVPTTFALALLAAPPAPGTGYNLRAVTALPRTPSPASRPCRHGSKASVLQQECKTGAERDLGHLDADVEHINEAIAARYN